MTPRIVHVSRAMRRLTRLHVRSVEQPVNLDDGDDAFNYPWLYAGRSRSLAAPPSSQIKQIREFFDRGGFFMCDDFHGTGKNGRFSSPPWGVFFRTVTIVDIPNRMMPSSIIYDLSEPLSGSRRAVSAIRPHL